MIDSDTFASELEYCKRNNLKPTEYIGDFSMSNKNTR